MEVNNFLNMLVTECDPPYLIYLVSPIKTQVWYMGGPAAEAR